MQNTVVSTENEWGGKKECGMVRGSKDFPEKQDPGMGFLGVGGGNNKTVIVFFKSKGKKKGQNPKPKKEWHFHHTHSGPLVVNSQLYPQPPPKKQRRLKKPHSLSQIS